MSRDYPYYSSSKSKETIRGDVDPENFDFSEDVSNQERLDMLDRNEIIQLACDWAVAEAIKNGVEFDQDQPVTVDKWGVNYTFSEKTDPVTGETKQAFTRYLDWMGFWPKIHEGMQWSRLFGSSIVVFWDENGGIKNHHWKSETGSKLQDGKVLNDGLFYPPNQDDVYLDFTCFHPLAKGNGFECVDADMHGKPLLYKISIHTRVMREQQIYYIPAERVVELNSPRKQLQYGGSSRVNGLIHYAIIGEQMLKKVLSRMHKLSAGLLWMPGVTSGQLASDLDNDLPDNLSSLDRLYGGLEGKPEYIVPDLKPSQFDVFHQILTRTMARHLRISQKLMDGESQGLQASAGFDMFTSYTEMERIQLHYYRALEECFHKLGKEDPTYEWNPIIPREMMGQGPQPLRMDMNVRTEKEESESDSKDGLDESETDTSDTKTTNTTNEKSNEKT